MLLLCPPQPALLPLSLLWHQGVCTVARGKWALLDLSQLQPLGMHQEQAAPSLPRLPTHSSQVGARCGVSSGFNPQNSMLGMPRDRSILRDLCVLLLQGSWDQSWLADRCQGGGTHPRSSLERGKHCKVCNGKGVWEQHSQLEMGMGQMGRES